MSVNLVKVLFYLAVFNAVVCFHSAQPTKQSVGFANVKITPGFHMLANPLNATDNSIGELIKEVPEGTILFKLAEPNGRGGLNEAHLAQLQEMTRHLPPEMAAPICIAFSKPNLTMTWNGALQSASEVTGPYVAVPDAVSPQTWTPIEPRKFWRARKRTVDFSRFTANTFELGEWSNPAEMLKPGEGAIIFNPSMETVTIPFAGEVMQGNLTNVIPVGLSIRSSMVLQAGGVTSKLEFRPSPGDHVFLWNQRKFEQFTFGPDNAWTPSEPQLRVGESFLVFAQSATNWVRKFSIAQ
ncbi:MAG: hypothetical protein FJ403_06740 [Verrucomicrobia bacterium]|nr:hypothetical protein [Verrucomicrobiota bacterium]